MKRIGETQGIPNGNSYGYGRWPLVDHIGEAEPIRADGTCSNRYLVPSNNKTACILHHRMDVGFSYVLTGGRAELNLAPEKLATRSAVFFIPLFQMRADYGGMDSSQNETMAGDVFDKVRDAFSGLEEVLCSPRVRPATESVALTDRSWGTSSR